ncbi:MULTISPECIES: hypothetical protein [unclassified Pseudomonas]|uniref:hypothetical protein n=1 Tax=unclassified Pseudomonas TaxID=196821 RepID=UPI0012FF2131|nr:MULTISPECIES: hypothetical protein [unclassified Pseudomonas]
MAELEIHFRGLLMPKVGMRSDATFHVQRRQRSSGRSTLVHAFLTSLSASGGEILGPRKK